MDFKLTVREAGKAEFDSVKRFIRENEHHFNAMRQDAVLLDRIENKKIVLAELDDGDIVGVSGVFEHGPDGELREAGATRIVLNGFKLQNVFHYARSVKEYILDSDYDAYFGVVHRTNARSLANLVSVAFVQSLEVENHIRIIKDADPHLPDPKYFLELRPNAVCMHARRLLELEQRGFLARPSRVHPGHFERAQVTLDLEVLNDDGLRHYVELLADGQADIDDS